MTAQEIQLVAALAGLALAVTLGDLILSLIRHWRRASLARGLRAENGDPLGENPEVAGEAMVRRLLAIEGASERSPSPADRGMSRG